MNDNELITKVWKYAITGIAVLVLCLTGSCQNTKYQIRTMIESGTHPYLAECAVTDARCDELLVLELERLQ